VSSVIENCISQNSHFYIFGAGSIALKIKNIIKSKDKYISSYIVSLPTKTKQIEGIEIKSLSQYSEFNTDLPIIIAVFNREENSFLPDIIIKLKTIGFKKIITYPEFHAIFHAELGNDFWLTDKQFYMQNMHYFDEALALFNDQDSRNNYSLIIDYLKSYDPFILKKFGVENQYFPLDIKVWSGNSAFFDIGSYDGENIVDAFKANGMLELVVAFEPDLINFAKIVSNSNLKKYARQLFIYPCGVWSETKMLRFKSVSGESSSYNAVGDLAIPVVKLDEVIHTKPGYLKMDIEGAEIEALLGAKETICEFKPSLAISLYHCPDHFYTIPLLINSWDLGYQFYVRLYGNNLFETVLYCVQ
jgi:FkbM family methyltransferase